MHAYTTCSAERIARYLPGTEKVPTSSCHPACLRSYVRTPSTEEGSRHIESAKNVRRGLKACCLLLVPNAQTVSQRSAVMLAKTVSCTRPQRRRNSVRIRGSHDAYGKAMRDPTNRRPPGYAHAILLSPDPACCVTLPTLHGIAEVAGRSCDSAVFRILDVDVLIGLPEAGARQVIE
jgi:hypothetical protein